MSTPSESQAFLLTPPGAAAIAVIRISGPTIDDFLRGHFTGAARIGRAAHGELHDGGRVLDDPVVVMVRAGVADINLHGGAWVVRSVFDLLAREGFRVHDVRGVPLPAAAIDSEDPLEQEVLSSLPLALTELGVRSLLAQSAAWMNVLRDAPAVEAVRAMQADRTMERLLHPARVAIVGAANVGKSTLANQLFGRERSITADLPGTTRDWIGEMADLDGVPVMLIDTPGQRSTDDPIEQAAILQSRGPIGEADLVVVVLDAARPLDAEQLDCIDRYPAALIALNKVDRPIVWADRELGGADLVRIVATSGAGLPELRRAILRRLECTDLAVEVPRCWTDRQRRLLIEIEAGLGSAIIPSTRRE